MRVSVLVHNPSEYLFFISPQSTHWFRLPERYVRPRSYQRFYLGDCSTWQVITMMIASPRFSGSIPRVDELIPETLTTYKSKKTLCGMVIEIKSRQPSGKRSNNYMEKHHVLLGKIHYKWPCSIAILT